MSKKNEPFCKDCIYFSKDGRLTSCDYILIEKHRRPCKAGEGCTVKQTRGTRASVNLIESTT